MQLEVFLGYMIWKEVEKYFRLIHTLLNALFTLHYLPFRF